MLLRTGCVVGVRVLGLPVALDRRRAAADVEVSPTTGSAYYPGSSVSDDDGASVV